MSGSVAGRLPRPLFHPHLHSHSHSHSHSHTRPSSFFFIFTSPSPSTSTSTCSSSSSYISSSYSLPFLPTKPLTLQRPPLIKIRAMPKRDLSFKTHHVASSADLHFEPPLKIVEYPDPRLRANNKRIDTFDDNLNKLVQEMFDVMYKTDGIGLSAPQVGINVQLMVFNPSGERGEGEEIVLINPKVNKYSQRIVPFEEGCLSFPKIYGNVQRPESIKIDARDMRGARFTVTLSGLPARVFQHEFDHLQGILFFERMADDVLDTIRADLQALEKKYEEITGLPSPEKIESRKTRKAAVGFGKK